MPPNLPATTDPRRILAVAVNGIGDNLMALPALHRIRRAFPHAEIHLAANTCNGAAAMLALANDVDRIVPFSFDAQRRFPYLDFYLRQWPELRRSLRASHYDISLCIAANRLRRSLLAAARAPRTELGADQSLNPYLAWHALADALGAPASNMNAAANARADDNGNGIYGNLLRDTAAATGAPERYGLERGHYIIVSLSGKAASRSYNRAGALLQKLRTLTPLPLVLVGSPAPATLPSHSAATASDGVLDLRGHTDLASANALCAHCRAALCVDGGLLYSVAAWGKPVLALFGPIHSRHRTPPDYPATWLALDAPAPLEDTYQRASVHVPPQADINSHEPQAVAEAFASLPEIGQG